VKCSQQGGKNLLANSEVIKVREVVVFIISLYPILSAVIFFTYPLLLTDLDGQESTLGKNAVL
jgi:hypothetical protein